MTKVHMDELAPALERASAGPDLELLCVSAFNRACDEAIDAQLEWARSEQGDVAATKRVLEEMHGRPATDEEAEAVLLRTIIGAAFSQGLRVGLEIARGRGWTP